MQLILLCACVLQLLNGEWGEKSSLVPLNKPKLNSERRIFSVASVTTWSNSALCCLLSATADLPQFPVCCLLTSSRKHLHHHPSDIQVGERGRNIKTLTCVWRPSSEATADQGELFKKRCDRCMKEQREGFVFGGGIEEEEEGWIMKRCRVSGIHPVVQTVYDSDLVLGLTLESWRGLMSGFGSGEKQLTMAWWAHLLNYNRADFFKIRFYIFPTT